MKILLKGIEIELLHKFKRHKWIGRKHTSVDNLPKGFPPKYHGLIYESYGHLTQLEYFKIKPTKYGTEVSLNPRKMDKISKVVNYFIENLSDLNHEEFFEEEYEIEVN